MGIESVSNNNQNIEVPVTVDQAAISEQVQAVIDDIAPLISDENNLNVNSTKRVDEDEKTVETKDAPELEEADELTALKADLEALIALLQAEQDEKQLEAAQARIKSLEGQLEAHHNQTMEKVQESLDAMKEQENASLASKIFGWIGVAVSLVVACAMIASGAGAAGGIALIGAMVGLTTQILNETGAMDKIVSALADLVKDISGCDSTTAKAWATGIVGAVTAAITIALMVCSFNVAGVSNLGNLAGEAAQKAAQAMQTVKIATAAAQSVTTIGGLTTNGISTYLSYNAEEKESAVTETQKLLTQLQTMLEQEESDLEELLTLLNDSLDAVVELLESKQDTLTKITSEIGA